MHGELAFYNSPMPDDIPCPQCDSPVQAGDNEAILVCRICGEQFFASEPAETLVDVTGEPDADDGTPQAAFQQAGERDRDLNSVRIRALSAERRAMYRTRSFLIVAIAGCGIGGYELLDRLRWYPFNGIGRFADVVLALACVAGIFFFAGKVRQLQRELRQPVQREPDGPPDFSTLRDGSQVWSDLEQMTRHGD